MHAGPANNFLSLSSNAPISASRDIDGAVDAQLWLEILPNELPATRPSTCAEHVLTLIGMWVKFGP